MNWTVRVSNIVPRDDKHNRAKALLPKVSNAADVWLSEAILVEVGNALSSFNRQGAARVVQQCYHTPNMRVVTVVSDLMTQGLNLYQSRPDKDWGLTDCISFVVIANNKLLEAVTTDATLFKQAFGQSCWIEELPD